MPQYNISFQLTIFQEWEKEMKPVFTLRYKETSFNWAKLACFHTSMLSYMFKQFNWPRTLKSISLQFRLSKQTDRCESNLRNINYLNIDLSAMTLYWGQEILKLLSNMFNARLHTVCFHISINKWSLQKWIHNCVISCQTGKKTKPCEHHLK